MERVEKNELVRLRRELAAKEQELEICRAQLSQMRCVAYENQEKAELLLAQWRSMRRLPVVRDADWPLLYLYVELRYPKFECRLRNAVGHLIQSEYRLCLLICLGFVKNQELGALLGIEPRSVIKYKQRLRQRVVIGQELPQQGWLQLFIAHLVQEKE
ncbi:MAG: hypothetical protein ACI3ZY_11775 [Parabacteroides sp.]